MTELETQLAEAVEMMAGQLTQLSDALGQLSQRLDRLESSPRSSGPSELAVKLWRVWQRQQIAVGLTAPGKLDWCALDRESLWGEILRAFPSCAMCSNSLPRITNSGFSSHCSLLHQDFEPRDFPTACAGNPASSEIDQARVTALKGLEAVQAHNRKARQQREPEAAPDDAVAHYLRWG